MSCQHHGPNLDPFIGYAVLGSLEANRQSAEYQRQQLNLLRRHQGLAPIPPPRESNLAAWILVLYFGPFAVLFAVAAVAGVWRSVPGGPVIVLGVGYLILAPVGRWIRRKYEDLTDWVWERRELRRLGR